MAMLCERWGYTPDQVPGLPSWVFRMTHLLAEAGSLPPTDEEQQMLEALGGHG